jgi:2-polyprenyl-3-methyl-5-hydroxy-6-metoxy-1,4-benzoquinol methylase
LAHEALLLALLQSKVVHDLELEHFLTALRHALLQHVVARGDEMAAASLEFFCALAQQCFLNEYVFACGDTEHAQVGEIRDRIAAALDAGADIASLDLIAVASYQALHTLPFAAALLARTWPDVVEPLLRQQAREPLQEASDRANIPALTTIGDSTSLLVQNQYDENPYPRWVSMPPIKPTTVADYLREELPEAPLAWPSANLDILVAGCGTGSHSIDTGLRFPQSRVLAVDISRASLAHARRKSRELELANIDYGQADILRLEELGRRFDVIEAVGVLHHLGDPAAGWRRLISLLRPRGLMEIGLYSAVARQSLKAARTFIAERRYGVTGNDIRACRQELIQRFGMPPFRDFSSTSGCRDLLFNVMEHEFTIPQLVAFIDANALSFLGFTQLPPETANEFRQEFSSPGAWQDLNAWASFERKHPLTFGNMYIFWVQKRDAD